MQIEQQYCANIAHHCHRHYTQIHNEHFENICKTSFLVDGDVNTSSQPCKAIGERQTIPRQEMIQYRQQRNQDTIQDNLIRETRPFWQERLFAVLPQLLQFSYEKEIAI